MPARVTVVATTQLPLAPRTYALDAAHGRLITAASSGVSSIRCPSLGNAGAWIDEACDGYWDLGDHLRSVRSLAVSGSGRFIATVADNETRCVVHMMDPFGGRNFGVHKVLEHRHAVTAAAYATNGTTLLVATGDGRVRGWEIETDGSTTASASLVHDHKVASMRAGSCKDLGRTLLASLCVDGSVWLWDTDKWCVLTKIQARGGHLMGADAAEHGTGRERGPGGTSAWGIYHTVADKEADWKGHVGEIVDCDLSEDGFMLATASRDRTCKVWQLVPVLYDTHEEARAALGVGPAVYLARVQLAEDCAGTSASLLTSLSHYAPCHHARFAPASDKLVVTCSADASCFGWHIPSGEKRFQISLIGVPGMAPTLMAIASEQGRAVAASSSAKAAADDDGGIVGSPPAPSTLRIYLSVGSHILSCRVREAAPGAQERSTLGRQTSFKGAGLLQTAHTEAGCAGQGRNSDYANHRLEGVDCPWLVVQRQRLLKQGLALRDIPWILATRILTPHALLKAFLQGLGMSKQARSVFQQILPTLGIPKVHFLRQVATCSNMSLVAKLVAMVWSNGLHSLRLPPLVSPRTPTLQPLGPVMLILPPVTTASGRDANKTGAPAPGLPRGPTTPRDRHDCAGVAGKVVLTLPAGRGPGGGNYVEVSEGVIDHGIAEAVRFIPWRRMGGSASLKPAATSSRVAQKMAFTTASTTAGADDVSTLIVAPKTNLTFGLASGTQALLVDSKRGTGDSGIPAPQAPTGPHQSLSLHIGNDLDGNDGRSTSVRTREISKLVTCAGSAHMLLRAIPVFDAGVDESIVSVVDCHSDVDGRFRSSEDSRLDESVCSTPSKASTDGAPALHMALTLHTTPKLQPHVSEMDEAGKAAEVQDSREGNQSSALEGLLQRGDGSGGGQCAEEESAEPTDLPNGGEAGASPQPLLHQVKEWGGSAESDAGSRAGSRTPRRTGVAVQIHLSKHMPSTTERGGSNGEPDSDNVDEMSAWETVQRVVSDVPQSASSQGNALPAPDEPDVTDRGPQSVQRGVAGVRTLPLHRVPRDNLRSQMGTSGAGVQHVVTNRMPIRDPSGCISVFAGRPPSRRPLTGVKVDGRDSRERAAQLGAISARALSLNTKANIWPSGQGPTGGARQGQPTQGSRAPGRVTKPPMSAPRVVGVGVGMPYGVRTADETPLDSPCAHASDVESIRSQQAPGDGQQPDDGGTPRPDDGTWAGGGCHASGGDARAETGAGRAQPGRGSIDMWRGAGEDVWLETGGGGHHTDADKANMKELPGWLFYVPLVLVSLEPARKGVWDALAFSRHAHAQLEGSWTASNSSDAILAAPPENEPPQPHTARATPRSRDNSNSGRGDNLKMETPRRFADRLMGEQISNVQWRSSLRTNSNVVGLALALPHTPRQQAAKDSLRDPPASEQGLALFKGRKLIQSISVVDAESNDYFPVCVMRQHCFLACAGDAGELDEWGKLVLHGPPRPVPVVQQPPA